MKPTPIRYPETEELAIRQEIFIVLASHTVWKAVFFESVEQAFNVIKMFNRHESFKKEGKSLIGEKSGRRFTVYSVKEYTKMDDIGYALNY